MITAVIRNGPSFQLINENGIPYCQINEGYDSTLQGYTSSTVSIKFNNTIRIYNDRGMPVRQFPAS